MPDPDIETPAGGAQVKVVVNKERESDLPDESRKIPLLFE